MGISFKRLISLTLVGGNISLPMTPILPLNTHLAPFSTLSYDENRNDFLMDYIFRDENRNDFLMDYIFRFEQLRKDSQSDFETKRTNIEDLLQAVSEKAPKNMFEYLAIRKECAWWILYGEVTSNPAFKAHAIKCLNHFLTQTEKSYWGDLILPNHKININWKWQDFDLPEKEKEKVETFLLKEGVILKTLILSKFYMFTEQSRIKEFAEKWKEPLIVVLSLKEKTEGGYSLNVNVYNTDLVVREKFSVRGYFGDGPLLPTSYLLSLSTNLIKPVVGFWDESWQIVTLGLEEEKSYSDFIESQSDRFLGENLDILRIHAVSKVIRSFLNIFTEVGQGNFLPEMPSLKDVLLLGNNQLYPSEHWLQVSFLSPLSIIPLPHSTDFIQRAQKITQFVQQLKVIALEEKMNPEYFLAQLLGQSSLVEKSEILISLIIAIERALDEETKESLVKPDSDLLEASYKELKEVLEFAAKSLKDLPETMTKDVVKSKLDLIESILNKIPVNENRKVDRKIGLLLFDLYEAPHPLVKQRSRQWHASRFEFQKHFPLSLELVTPITSLDRSI